MIRRLARWATTTLLGWHESWWDETDTFPRMGRALGYEAGRTPSSTPERTAHLRSLWDRR